MESSTNKYLSLKQDNTAHNNSTIGFSMNFAAPSIGEVARILNEGAYSVGVKDVNSVYQYHGAQTQASSPCDDSFIHGKSLRCGRHQESRWFGEYLMAMRK